MKQADQTFGEGNWEYVGTRSVGRVPVHLFRLSNVESEWGHLTANTLSGEKEWFSDIHPPTEEERHEFGL